ncbi:hypothetical protein SAMN06273572_102393 [Monaibacterium marinum]|uniref:Uncharacterized protein n=1 Tax=Pontivivens marinum TaxID=1690039 RepID=A0A2C9CRB8_9RHOB|nr:hypothetical protein SAMN06273572_102393 [Monaibacterium marinum]
MAGIESTSALHVVLEPVPVQDGPVAHEIVASVRSSDIFTMLSDIQVSAHMILAASLLTIFIVVSVAWYMRGRRAGTQRALATFEKSGRRGPRARVNRQKTDTDYRALRKSRPIIPKPDPTREIYVLRPLPDPRMHPFARDQRVQHSNPVPQENPL